jgi:hypothetical protein
MQKELVSGIFSHCDPLYVGKVLCFEVGILMNSSLYSHCDTVFFLYERLFCEENFLREIRWEFDECATGEQMGSISVRHWENIDHDSVRWMQEYNTQFVWIAGILLIILPVSPGY